MTEPKKAGRPTTDPATHRKREQFSLAPDTRELLAQLAEELDLPKSRVVELALRRLAGREGER